MIRTGCFFSNVFAGLKGRMPLQPDPSLFLPFNKGRRRNGYKWLAYGISGEMRLAGLKASSPMRCRGEPERGRVTTGIESKNSEMVL